MSSPAKIMLKLTPVGGFLILMKAVKKNAPHAMVYTGFFVPPNDKVQHILLGTIFEGAVVVYTFSNGAQFTGSDLSELMGKDASYWEDMHFRESGTEAEPVLVEVDVMNAKELIKGSKKTKGKQLQPLSSLSDHTVSYQPTDQAMIGDGYRDTKAMMEKYLPRDPDGVCQVSLPLQR
jgi:hypothetical protein